MTTPAPKDVTQLLHDWSNGDKEALDRLLPLVYDELRRVAARYLGRERPGHTLQPTALVHEAYIRLLGESQVSWQGRAHFFGAAARLMRRILVDHARERNAAKRGHGLKVTLNEALAPSASPDLDLVALDRALEELSALDAEQARIVELRFFGGLSVEETAEVLSVSPATVKRHWVSAKAWLRRAMS